MKKITFFASIIAFIFFFSCKKEIKTPKSEYFDLTIENFKNSKSSISIVKGEIDGEVAHLLNREEGNADWPEYIINEQCDTICSTCGECLKVLKCQDCFEKNEQETIWKK
jgi:hypothetical protein